MSAVIKVFVVVVVVAIAVQSATARTLNYRIKRVTDNHLADLETKIALNNKLKGIVVTMPVGGGRIDPLRIGRRRRSESRMLDVLFNQSEEDRGDPREFDYSELFHRFRLQ